MHTSQLLFFYKILRSNPCTLFSYNTLDLFQRFCPVNIRVTYEFYIVCHFKINRQSKANVWYIRYLCWQMYHDCCSKQKLHFDLQCQLNMIYCIDFSCSLRIIKKGSNMKSCHRSLCKNNRLAMSNICQNVWRILTKSDAGGSSITCNNICLIRHSNASYWLLIYKWID